MRQVLLCSPDWPGTLNCLQLLSSWGCKLLSLDTLWKLLYCQVFLGSLLPPSSSLPFCCWVGITRLLCSSCLSGTCFSAPLSAFQVQFHHSGCHSFFVVLSFLWPILYLLLLGNVRWFLSLRDGRTQLRNWCVCHWQTLQKGGDWLLICDLGTEIVENSLHPRLRVNIAGSETWSVLLSRPERAVLCNSIVESKDSLRGKCGCLVSPLQQAKP